MPATRHARTGLRLLLALGLAVALLGAACSSDGGSSTAGTNAPNIAAPTDEGEATPGGVLRVGLGAELDGLNPVQARWSLEGNMVGSAVYDTLLTFGEDRNLVPRLATSVEPNEDGTVWTITVRDDVVFHDGTPFDAEVVKANIEARREVPITGTALKQVESIEVTSPTTLEVRMSGPWFGFDYTLAAQGGYQVAPSLIDDPDGMRKAVGTGPFRFDGVYSPGEDIVLTRNEDYWDTPAYLDGLEFRAIVGDGARADALLADDVGMILTRDADAVVEFRATDGFEQVEDVAGEESFAMLNLAEPPFDNINARRAVAQATDREAVNEALGQGIQVDADQPYTPEEQYYVEDSGYPDYDPTAAAESVQAYESETGQPLSFSISTTAGQQTEAEILQQQWTAAGMDVQVEAFDQTAFLASTFGGAFQVAMFRNFAYVNPDSNYIFWHSSYSDPAGGINFGHLESDEVGDALDTARATDDEAARTEEYQRLVQAINAEIPFVWLYHVDWGLAAKEQVGGLTEPQRLGFARQDGKPFWNEIWLEQ